MVIGWKVENIGSLLGRLLGRKSRSSRTRRMGQVVAVAGLSILCQHTSGSLAQQVPPNGLLNPGDLVVTGFSGTISPDANEPLPPNTALIDETFIDLERASAKIFDIAAPQYVWDGRLWDNIAKLAISAREIGQVFGVAIDDRMPANIYFTATSAFGLHIVVADQDNDGRPERISTGQAGAQWMPGQLGADRAATPGSIWKFDGATGNVSLFANIELNGQPNSGAGLGNIAYDAHNRQLFVSDLDTGMIHKLDLAGNELERFDHGTTGRSAAQLPEVAFNTSNRLDITSSDFDSEDPDTWAFAALERRVWGLAVHEKRLYYSIAEGPQIWSVGIADDGRLLDDPRWELDVWKDGRPLEVSDIVLSNKGAMILAQRGERGASYDYSTFFKPRKARIYRYWREDPDDPQTNSVWILEPEEYAVGFPVNHRNTNGGIDLGYGYSENGEIDLNVCEVSLWTTGGNLRRNQQLRPELLKGGPENVHGVQGAPARPVREFNTPPWASYMLDFDSEYDDPQAAGHIGDVEIYQPGCRGTGEVETVYYGGPGYEWPTGTGYTVPNGNGDCPYCPPPPPVEACMEVVGVLQCNLSSGQWVYNLSVFDSAGIGADSVKILSTTPGVSSPGIVSLGGQIPVTVNGAGPGQPVVLQLCAFNQTAANSAEPFECCRQTITLIRPASHCPIQ
jgi:hypothetical protein